MPKRTRKTKVLARMEWLTEYKTDKPCADCGKVFDPICMDFHHFQEHGYSVWVGFQYFQVLNLGGFAVILYSRKNTFESSSITITTNPSNTTEMIWGFIVFYIINTNGIENLALISDFACPCSTVCCRRFQRQK